MLLKGFGGTELPHSKFYSLQAIIMGLEGLSFHIIPVLILVISTCVCVHAHTRAHTPTHTCCLLVPSFVMFTAGFRQEHRSSPYRFLFHILTPFHHFSH